MDERLHRLAGEPIREFGISRKTGYKIFDRYQECGIPGLTAGRLICVELSAADHCKVAFAQL